MRTRIILSCALALVLGAAALVALSTEDKGGGGDGGDGEGGEPVAASFYPLAFAAEELGADQVENLTPPGAEPHDLELSAGAVEALQSADTVLLMGGDFQPQLEQAADRASGQIVEVLKTPGLELLPNDDPHIWLDPIRFVVATTRIAEALGRPDAAAGLESRLRELDREYHAALANCDRRELVTSHDAFGYLADRYGLHQIPITGISPEAEPTPAELQDSIDEVRRTGATVVFSEALVSPRLSETVARETGADTEVLNTLEGLTADEEANGEDYFSLMRENLAKLQEALACR